MGRVLPKRTDYAIAKDRVMQIVVAMRMHFYTLVLKARELSTRVKGRVW